MRFRPAIVVLAAGSGRRFLGGGHKLAAPLHGSTVLELTLQHAVRTQLPVLAVTSEVVAPLASAHLARRDIVVLSARDAARGMGHSIAVGVAERSGAPGWLLLPGDLPLVRPSTTLAVARALEHHAVVCAEWRGRRGHPVGFAAELYSELIRLEGDEGARRIVARYPAHAVDCGDDGVVGDVDTAADLALLRSRPPLPDAAGQR